jgi:hypothetical protein
VRAFSVSGATPNLKMLIQELAPDELGAVSLLAGLIDVARAITAAEVASSHGSLAYVDAPAVTSLVAEPSATGGTVGLDIWHRPFGVLGLSSVPPTVPPAMLAGVIPHAVERVVMEGGPVSATAKATRAVSVGAVFEAAAQQGVATRLLSGSLPADLTVEPQVRELLQRALDGGWLVIIPEHPVDLGGQARRGWWLVDPVSGAAVDQMDDGGGISQGEYIFLIVGGAVLLVGLAYLWETWSQIVDPVPEESETQDPIERNWMRDAAERARQQQRMKDVAQKAVRFQQY